MPRVSFIGVDGLSTSILRMLYESGVCREAREVLGMYEFIEAESLKPPLSCGCWVSIATGLHPGYTGVLDCVSVVFGRKSYVDSSVYRRVSVWDRALKHGLKPAVLEYPLLTPAYEVGGGVIVSTWGLDRTSYPESLMSSLDEELGREYMRVELKHPWSTPEDCVEDATSTLEDKIRASEYIIGVRDWDLYVEVIVESDWVLHRTLHCIDESHPRRRECSVELRGMLREFWSTLLEHVAWVSRESRASIIASDHGFKPLCRVYDLREHLRHSGVLSGVYTTAPAGAPYPGLPVYFNDSCCLKSVLSRLSSTYRVYNPRLIYEGPLSSLLPNAVFEPLDEYSAVSWGCCEFKNRFYTGVHSGYSMIGFRGFRASSVKSILDYKRVILGALGVGYSKTSL